MKHINRYTILYFIGFAGLFVPAFATLCDNYYRISHATQTILAGQHLDQLSVVSVTELNGNLDGLQFLHDSIEYKIITGFQGVCYTPQKNPMTYKVRERGTEQLTDKTESNLYIAMYDNQLAGTNILLWFGMGPEVSGGNISPLTDAIGTDDPANPFIHWYGTAVFIDSVKNQTTGLWQWTTNYYRNLFSFADSIRIDTSLVSDWKSVSFDGVNHRGFFTIQFIKIYFDSVTAGVPETHEIKPFQSSLSFLTGPESFQIPFSGAFFPGNLFLYSISGAHVATVPGINNSYLWDGKNCSGQQVPSGIYLVRGNTSWLGKLYYIRH
jgi:hypothetical protein